MFGVLRFVIQPFALLWRRQPINAEPQNIEQANWRRKGLLTYSLGSDRSCVPSLSRIASRVNSI